MIHGLVSVIIPVFNIEQYLSNCLESIVSQTYPDLEIILVDDGSTDESSDICQLFAASDSRIKVIRQDNQGLWAARNTGCKNARGEFIMFVDGDDYLHLSAIELLHDAICRDGGYDLALMEYQKTDRLDEDIRIEGDIIVTTISQEELVSRVLKKDVEHISNVVWNKLYKRELIEGIWSRPYVRAQDVDYSLRVYLRIDKAIWIHQKLYYYNMRGGSLSHTPDYRLLFLECTVDIFYNNYCELSEENKKKYSGLLLQKLYVRSIFLQAVSMGSERQDELYRKCQEYLKKTQKFYVRSSGIPIVKKVGTLFLLRYPKLARRLITITNN